MQERLKSIKIEAATDILPVFCWDTHLVKVKGRNVLLIINASNRYTIAMTDIEPRKWNYYTLYIGQVIQASCMIWVILFFTIKEFYRRELGVIVKKDTYIFQCYPRAFTFHADVGCGGTSELYSLYNFWNVLIKRGKCLQGYIAFQKKSFTSC